MAIKFEKIGVGMILLDVHREKMGNTTMSEWGEWQVKIISIDREKGYAMVSWNGNPPTQMWRRALEKLYRESPKCIRDQRERKAMRGW